MKRLTITAAAVCALALASVATAATQTNEYRGTIEPDSRMKFETLVRHNVPVKVEHFTWRNVTVRCAEGSVVADGSFDDSMRVRDKRFHGTLVGPNGAKAHVTGRFRHHFRRATGTFRIHGDITDVQTSCHTGELAWAARRV
jgi:hypothetical protein